MSYQRFINRSSSKIAFSIAAGAVIGSCLILSPAASALNLLVNPSFEQGAFIDRGDGYQILPNGSTAITGWTVINDSLAWGTYPNAAVNTSPILPFDGNFFLDLQGDGLFNAPYGGVSQSLLTVIGQQYHLSFYLGTQQDAASPFTHGPVSVTASAGAMSSPFTFNPLANSGTQWGEFGFDFTANSASTLISIIGMNPGTGAYIGLDLVSVTAASPIGVPEGGASSAALLAISLAAFWVARRSIAPRARLTC